MQANAGAALSSTGAGYRNVDQVLIPPEQAPEHGGTAVADHGALPRREDRRHPPTVRGEAGVSDGIDPAVNPMELTPTGTLGDRVPSQSRRDELSKRDDPVLPFGDSGDAKIGCGAFVPHVGE